MWSSEFLVREIKKTEDKEVIANNFYLIAERHSRIHSSHFNDASFCEKFYVYLRGTPDPSGTLLRFSTENKKNKLIYLMMGGLSLRGLTLELPKAFFDNGEFGEGVLGVSLGEGDSLRMMVSGESTYSFKDPEIFEDHAPREERTLRLPPVELLVIEGVSAYSGGQVVKNGSLIVYEESANPLKRKFIAGLHDKIFRAGDSVIGSFKYNKAYELNQAVLFFSRCPTNYFHWMIEYLPRLKSLVDMGLTSIPVLVPKGLANQQYEALDILVKRFDLKLYYIDPSFKVKLNKVYIPSPVTFHPDDPDVPFWMGAGLHSESVKFLRNNLMEGLGVLENKSPKEKIFLARSGNLRNVANISEIHRVVQEEGFTLVYPERFSLKEQASIMANARVVISPGGSSLTNVIFMSPGAKLISLIGHQNRYYSIYANLADLCGVSYLHVTGEPTMTLEQCGSDLNYMHSGYKVDAEKLRRAIRSWGN